MCIRDISTTGFNVIALNVPNAATTVSASFLGLSPGTDLAPDDPGEDVYKRQMQYLCKPKLSNGIPR